VPIWQGEVMTLRSLLCWGTIEGAPMHELVATAALAGFTGVSITPAMYFASRALGRSDRDLRAELDDLGVAVMVIDPLITGLPGIPSPDDVGPRFRSTFVYDERDCYRAAEAVGARAINVAHYLGAPTELGVLADAIGAMAERAAPKGIDVLVESMPDGAIPDVTAAAAIVAAVGADNCGLMLDTWHHWRCGGDLAELRALPPSTIRAVQLSDALDDVRGSGPRPPTRDRLMPGDGVIPLAEVVAIARANCADVILGIEVFNRELAARPVDERSVPAKASLDTVVAAAADAG
jgi:sugar phosphate isomerase/epimerase